MEHIKSIVRIGLIGNVDAGKSTLLGLLTKLKPGEYDDGRGYARSKILKYPHEQSTGRTSSITKEHETFGDKIIEFVDLAGHEPYLKTTMSGLCGGCIDYAFLIVGANMGVGGMTKEHLNIALGLNIPVIVIITKIDISPVKKLKETMTELRSMLKLSGGKKFMVHVTDETSFKSCIETPKKTPVIQISCKSGHNIELLRHLISLLPKKYEFKDIEGINKFWIHYVYLVPGTGIVLYGIVTSGQLKKGLTMQLGPFNGKFKNVIIKSLHDDDRNNIDVLPIGKTGCIALRKGRGGKNPIKRNDIIKGMILCNEPSSTREFLAHIIIFHHSTTIKNGYHCMIHCGLVRQTVEFSDITNLKNKDIDVLRTGDRGDIHVKFVYRPEYIEEGTRFMIREGKTIAIGIIKKLL